jgi:DNA-directed RNA polymerase specialized sigma24 family protein
MPDMERLHCSRTRSRWSRDDAVEELLSRLLGKKWTPAARDNLFDWAEGVSAAETGKKLGMSASAVRQQRKRLFDHARTRGQELGFIRNHRRMRESVERDFVHCS